MLEIEATILYHLTMIIQKKLQVSKYNHDNLAAIWWYRSTVFVVNWRVDKPLFCS